MRSRSVINAVGTSGENDAFVTGCFYLLNSDFTVRLYFGVNMQLSDASGDKLVILTAEIQHKNLFIHRFSPLTARFVHFAA